MLQLLMVLWLPILLLLILVCTAIYKNRKEKSILCAKCRVEKAIDIANVAGLFKPLNKVPIKDREKTVNKLDKIKKHVNKPKKTKKTRRVSKKK